MTARDNSPFGPSLFCSLVRHCAAGNVRSISHPLRKHLPFIVKAIFRVDLTLHRTHPSKKSSYSTIVTIHQLTVSLVNHLDCKNDTISFLTVHNCDHPKCKLSAWEKALFRRTHFAFEDFGWAQVLPQRGKWEKSFSLSCHVATVNENHAGTIMASAFAGTANRCFPATKFARHCAPHIFSYQRWQRNEVWASFTFQNHVTSDLL